MPAILLLWHTLTKPLSGWRRFLADQPLAFPERLQALLPQLLSLQGHAAAPFLLPLLTQLADPLELRALLAAGPDKAARAWPQALRQPQVRMRMLGITAWLGLYLCAEVSE